MYERLTLPVKTEIRADEDSGRIVGYAAVFNSLSEDFGGWREIVRPGSFTKTLREKRDIRALWNHETSYVLGRTLNGTLTLREDENGLRVEITPPDTQWASDLVTSIRRGDVSQMSFGFRTVRDNWRTDSNDTGTLRELLELELHEVSPVTFPAYGATDVQVRAFMAERGATLPQEIRSKYENFKASLAVEPNADVSSESSDGVALHDGRNASRKNELRKRLLTILSEDIPHEQDQGTVCSGGRGD